MAEYFGAKVEDIFNTMPERFKPDGVAGVDIIIGYDVKGEDGGRWTVTIKGNTLKVEQVGGDLPKCSVIISADPETFVGGTLGAIDLGEAMSAGKFKVDGDITILLNVLPKAFEKFTPVVKAKTIIETMPDRFRADKAEGVNMKIGYDLSGESGGQWTIVISDGSCAINEGIDSECTVVLRMASDVFVGLMTGKVDAGAAFGGGQVKIEGDMGAAGATAKFFTKFTVGQVDEKKGEELISIKVVNSIDQRFATGPYMGKWFAGLKEKKFYASKCPVCGRTLIPPREGCANCRVRVTEFVEVGPKATVNVVDPVYYASPDPLTGKVRQTPYATMFLVMDNGTEDEIFGHDLNPKDIDRIKPGMKVRPVWNEVRTGGISDLLYFEIDD